MNEHRTRQDATTDVGLRLRMRSESRRIAAQHEELNRLRTAVSERIEEDGAIAALETFIRFMATLDAHMNLEEEIYFPALHGLDSSAGPELAELTAEHVEVRLDTVEIRKLLRDDERERARRAFDGLVWRIAKHEMTEEHLIARTMGRPAATRGVFEAGKSQTEKES
jgi:iron-sulfur cluster repair protein YtfE (RIC family)